MLSWPGLRSVILAWAVVLVGCRSTEEKPSPPDAGPPADAGADAAYSGPTCGAGQAPDGDGGCAPAGIQGCAAIFIDPDGVCRPSMSRCAAQPGTIPRFDQGCVPVGIAGCAPIFVGADGLCHPSMSLCPSGTFAVPQKGCVPIDGPGGCGSGTWGNLQDAPGTVWVDGSVAGPGTGTQADPVKTIGKAMTLVPAGGRVAIAPGTYNEHVTLNKTVDLEGRCPSMVRIAGSGVGAVVYVPAAGVTVRGIEVGGTGTGILAVSSAGLIIDQVHVRAASSSGVGITGATANVSITNSLIEATLPVGTTAPAFGRGVDITFSGTLSLVDSAVVGNHSDGIAFFDKTSGHLDDVLVEDTLPDVDGTSGVGVFARLGAAIVVVNSAMIGNHAAAIELFETSTHGQIEGNLLERTATVPIPQGVFAAGADVELGATADLAANAILANNYAGVFVSDPGTIVNLAGNLIARSETPPGTTMGLGVLIQNGASGKLDHDVLHQNRTLGLLVYDNDASAQLDGVLIEETLPLDASHQNGGGALSFLTGSITFEGCAIVGNTVGAVGVISASATISRCLLAATKTGDLADPDGGLHANFGDGLVAGFGATVVLDRTLIESNARAGMLFDFSGGSVTGCAATGNKYGLVLQGEPRPTYTLSANAFHGNTAIDVYKDGDLQLPSQASSLP